MLVKRWRAPSRATTLTALRELAYFTSVFTVGTVTVLHLLELSRRTEELYRRAERVQKVETFKCSLRGSRSSHLMDVDDYILERLKSQSWDFEYRDPRACQSPPSKRKRNRQSQPVQSTNGGTSIPPPGTTSSADPKPGLAWDIASLKIIQRGLEYGGNGRENVSQCASQTRQLCPRMHSVRPGGQFAATSDLKSRPRWGQNVFLLNSSTRTIYTASGRRNGSVAAQTDAHLSTHSPDRDISILAELGIPYPELDFLVNLRAAMSGPKPGLAIQRLIPTLGEVDRSADNLWFNPSTIEYLCRVFWNSNISSHEPAQSPDIVLPAPLRRSLLISDPRKTFLIFKYLFRSSSSIPPTVPTQLALGILEHLMVCSKTDKFISKKCLPEMVAWLHRHDLVPRGYYQKAFQLMISNMSKFRSVVAAFEDFVQRMGFSNSPTAIVPFIIITAAWAISRLQSDDAYIWLQSQDMSFRNVSDIWAGSVSSVVSDLLARRSPQRARQVFFKSQFLRRCAHVTSQASGSLERLYSQTISSDPDLGLARIAFHTLVLLTAVHDVPDFVRVLFSRLEQHGHTAGFYEFISQFEIYEEVPVSQHLFHYFHFLSRSQASVQPEIMLRLVHFARRTGDTDIVLNLLDEIPAGSVMSKELAFPVLSALTTCRFSMKVLEKFHQVIKQPVDFELDESFAGHFCQMLQVVWMNTEDPLLLEPILVAAQQFFSPSTVPAVIPNLFCLILLKSKCPEMCFRVLELPGMELDAEGICLVAVAASHLKNWEAHASILQLNAEAIIETFSKDSFYGNSILESYIDTFGLVRTLELVDNLSARFGFSPTRRTVYVLSCSAFTESRFDLLPRILELTTRKSQSSFTNLLAPVLAALTRQWFKLSKPSSGALAQLMRGFHDIDSQLMSFHLHEIWNWGHHRFSSSARKFGFIKPGRIPSVTAVTDTATDLQQLDDAIQPLFRTRSVDELNSPVDLARLETVRSEVTIQIQDALTQHDYRQVAILFHDNIPHGIHTSARACRLLSMACSRSGQEGREMFADISDILAGRGMAFPLGVTEMLTVQESNLPLEIDHIVTTYYHDAVKSSKGKIGNSAVTTGGNSSGSGGTINMVTGSRASRQESIECSLAAAGALRLIALKQPLMAGRLLRKYYDIVKPVQPHPRFLSAFIRSCRLVGDLDGVIWAIHQALEADIQLDDQLFLQQVYLSPGTVFRDTVRWEPTSDSNQPVSTTPMTHQVGDESGQSTSTTTEKITDGTRTTPDVGLVRLESHLSQRLQTGAARTKAKEQLKALADRVFNQAAERKTRADEIRHRILAVAKELYAFLAEIERERCPRPSNQSDAAAAAVIASGNVDVNHDIDHDIDIDHDDDDDDDDLDYSPGQDAETRPPTPDLSPSSLSDDEDADAATVVTPPSSIPHTPARRAVDIVDPSSSERLSTGGQEDGDSGVDGDEGSMGSGVACKPDPYP